MAVPRNALILAALCAAVAVSSPAGNLEPPGPPAPTMKTLGDVAPVWSRTLDSGDGQANGCDSTRFTCVLGTAGVLDNETGLVWHRSPFALTGFNWEDARNACAISSPGSRGGWRLASLPELTSLLFNLPADHPFVLPGGGANVRFWTMTAVAGSPLRAWAVSTDGFAERRLKSDGLIHWCVRAPAAIAEY